MNKKIILLVLLLFLFNFSYATESIKTGITYNEISARIEAFSNVERKIDKKYFASYKKDKDYKENLEFIRNKKFKIIDKRTLCPFYAKGTLFAYAVVYENNKKNTYYYNIFGNLLKYDIVETGDYPRKTISYSKRGNLISISFEVSDSEQFIYDKDGKLIAHWVDDKLLENSRAKIFQITRGIED